MDITRSMLFQSFFIYFLTADIPKPGYRNDIISTCYAANGTKIGYIDEDSTILAPGNDDCYRVTIGNDDGGDSFTVWVPFYMWDGTAAPVIRFVQDYVEKNNFAFYGEIFSVGWGGVVDNPVTCTQPVTKETCPDIIILGTTQVAKRVQVDKIAEPLNDYIAELAFQNGISLFDDFVRFYLYDLSFNGIWHAIPVVSDVRVLLWNRTTFDTLGLEYPPPFGNWSIPYHVSWDWEQFLIYAQNITDSGIGKGFSFNPCWDEELKVLMMMAQSFGATLLNKNTSICNLRTTQFKASLEYIQFLFKNYTDYPVIQDQTFIDWVNEVNFNILSQPNFCCFCVQASNNFLPGMAISEYQLLKRYFSDAIYDTTRNPDAEIGIGISPGLRTFLGGSVMMMNKESTNKERAWNAMAYFVNSQNTYLDDMASALGSLPPYESYLSKQYWQDPKWEISKYSLEHSGPPQYPLPTFPQFGLIESKKPFRLLLMDILFKNKTMDEAIDRACIVIDDIFRPPSCGTEGQPACLTTFVANAGLSGFGYFLCTFGMVTTIFSGVFMAIKRNHDVMKRASVNYMYLFHLGIVLAFVLVGIFSANSVNPTNIKCATIPMLACLSFGLVFSVLLGKTLRIHLIFQFVHALKSLRNSDPKDDLWLLRVVLPIIGIFTLFGIVWIVLDPPLVTVITQGDLIYSTCLQKYPFWIYIFCALTGVLLLWGVYLAWVGRDLPDAFNESQWVGGSIYTVAIFGVLILPLGMILYMTPIIVTVIQIFPIFLCTFSVLCLNMAPRIWFVVMGITLDETSESRKIDSTTSGKVVD